MSAGATTGPPHRDHGALIAGRARTRRLWARYLVVLGVGVLVLGGVVGWVWWHSEIRAVALEPASQPARSLAPAPLAATLRPAWHSDDHTAQGQPVHLDVVVTWSRHTVTGRDARTGAARWTYTRSDRDVCGVIAQDGTAVAVYRHDGNCDEVTGLDIARGRRSWTRTFFENGGELRLSARPGYVLFRTPTSLHLLEPSGGLDWWYLPQTDHCAIPHAVLGSTGVLATRRCAGQPEQLVRESFEGDKDGRPKPAWSVAADGRIPLSADTIVSVLRADARAVVVLDEAGKAQATVALDAGTAAPDQARALPVSDERVEIVALRGELIALGGKGGAQLLWRTAGVGFPVDGADGLVCARNGGLAVLGVGSGQASTLRRLPGLGPDASVDLLGDGVVADGPSGTTAYS